MKNSTTTQIVPLFDRKKNERAAKYNMTVEEYKARNLLKMEVTAQHVASAVVELCSNRFGATTGAQIPIDGGNERTI